LVCCVIYMSSFLIFSISSHPFRPAALCSSSSSRPHVQKELRTRSRDLELMWREPPRCVLSNDPAPSRSHHISSSPRGSNDNRKKLGSLHISTIFPPCFFFPLIFQRAATNVDLGIVKNSCVEFQVRRSAPLSTLLTSIDLARDW
jgi:hypothetical protein